MKSLLINPIFFQFPLTKHRATLRPSTNIYNHPEKSKFLGNLEHSIKHEKNNRSIRRSSIHLRIAALETSSLGSRSRGESP